MSKEIELFHPGLPHTPGWTALNREEQDRLLERTSNIEKFRRMGAAAAIGEARELFLVQNELDGKKLTMGNYLTAVYGKSERTGWKRLQDYKMLRDVVSDAVIDAMVNTHGGLLQAPAGDIIRAAKLLPAPKSHEPKVIEGYVGKLREKLREDRQARRKGSRGLDPDDATRIFVTVGARVLREAKLGSSAEQRAWLKKAVGYLMERRAITGTVSAERTPIPEGFMPRRGRPRKENKVA